MRFLPAFLLLFVGVSAFAQEYTAPLQWRSMKEEKLASNALSPSAKPAASDLLPFFEDFTDNSIYPSSLRWTDSQVYINNTMPVSPISHGVATFDALNRYGRPYDSLNANALRYTDSLTSVSFDFSSYTADDSIYLSFFYQPQGRGFIPEVQDSLYLYFKRKTGGWQRIWFRAGENLQPFRQVIIPVIDTNFLYDDFRFRFVSKASLGSTDDIWNLDYIRMNTGRTVNDTALNDLAYADEPSPFLKDYYSMPYRHFLANIAAERATDYKAYIRNNYDLPNTITYGYDATAQPSGNSLTTGNTDVITIGPYNTQTIILPAYSAAIPLPGLYDKVEFEQTYNLTSPINDFSKQNDTLIKTQIFDNYLAYDDGTAEKSYYLALFATLPGSVVMEHHLNVKDTVKGFSIYFGQQVPTAVQKFFSINIFTKLAGIDGASADELLYTEDFLQPQYTDTQNAFTVYKLTIPVPLPIGTFYMGTMQPAASGSDTLYFGLDVNRVGGNHAYYNVLSQWSPSLVSGAIMMRPLLGQDVQATDVKDIVVAASTQPKRTFYPNPAQTEITITDKTATEYQLTDLSGRVVQKGEISASKTISIATLPAGIYLFRTSNHGHFTSPQKLIKI